MSAKAISEVKGKQLLAKYLSNTIAPVHVANFSNGVAWDMLANSNPWMATQKLVVKPDQLIKRRGKLGLIKVNADLAEVKNWVEERFNKEINVNKLNKIFFKKMLFFFCCLDWKSCRKIEQFYNRTICSPYSTRRVLCLHLFS